MVSIHTILPWSSATGPEELGSPAGSARLGCCSDLRLRGGLGGLRGVLSLSAATALGATQWLGSYFLCYQVVGELLHDGGEIL